MRLIMMGTGPFAVPTFCELYETHHTVVALVTGPVRTHRGKPLAPPSSIREVAQEHGTSVFDPEDVNSAAARDRLTAYEADLVVLCDYGQILSAETLKATRMGGLNLHGSLLPSYRGAAPVHWAIFHGETETGVTVIHMTPKVDAGPCVAQARLAIGPEETAVELEARLADLGAGLVRRAIDSLETGGWQALPQDPTGASKAPRLKKSDGQIDWTRPAEAIKNQVRAMEPWPRGYTFWHRPAAPPVRLILGRVSVVELAGCDTPPGVVVDASAGRLVVAAGQGGIVLRNVQPAGKRMMDAGQFLRGYRVRPGDRFGPE